MFASSSIPRPERAHWLWLGLAFAAAIFASGKWTVPLAVWLAPVFLVRVMRSRGILSAWAIAVAVFATAGWIGWRGVVPIGTGAVFVGFTAAAAVVDSLPFLADRILGRRLKGLLATLVLPAAYVSLQFGFAFVGPSTGIVAYSLYGSESMVQLASVGGVWVLSFLVLWTATGVNQLWEEGLATRSGIRPGWVPLLVVTLAVGWGGFRTALSPPGAETVRVAMVAKPLGQQGEEPWIPRATEQRYWQGGELTDDEWAAMGDGGARILDNLFEITRREAGAGARMVFWAEGNGLTRTEDLEPMVERGATLAREEEIYLGMALLVFPRSIEEGFLNKVVFLAPDGSVAARYRKAYPVPGPESWYMRPGDGEMAVVDTPYGRIGIVICYDLDYVRNARQAGRNQVDILVQPSLTWPDISRIHSEMATFRSIESGASLVRPTLNGVTLATDPWGRNVARAEDRYVKSHAVAAEVPVNGVRTLYGRFGDWAGWGSLLLLLLVGWRASRGPA